MNIETARRLSKGEWVHHVELKNADGTPMRARVTSIKTWKTRPNEIEVRVVHGLKDFAIFKADELDQIEPGYGRLIDGCINNPDGTFSSDALGGD